MTRAQLLIATLVIIGSRVLFLSFARLPELSGDALAYHHLARSLLAGRGYTNLTGDPHIWYMPGYPLFVAGIYGLVGENLLAVWVVQGALVGLSAALVHETARRLFGSRAALAALLLIALWPAWLTYPTSLNGETLLLVLVSLFVWVVARDVPTNPRARMGWAATAGALAGLLALVKPDFALLVPLPAIVASCQKMSLRRAVGLAAIGAAVFVLVLTPWVARNAIVFGRFIPFTISAGPAFWLSAHKPGLVDHGEPALRAALVRCGAEADAAVRARLGDDPKATESCLWRDGFRMVREHPGYWFGAVLRRAGETLFSSHTTYLIGYHMSFQHAWTTGETGVLAVKAWFLVVHSAFVCLGLAGTVWLTLSRRWRFFAYLVVAKLAVHAVLFATPRYGLPLTPILAITGGALIACVLAPRRASP